MSDLGNALRKIFPEKISQKIFKMKRRNKCKPLDDKTFLYGKKNN